MSAADTRTEKAEAKAPDVLLRQPDDTAALHFCIRSDDKVTRTVVVVPGKGEPGIGGRGVRVTAADHEALKGRKAFAALVAADKILVTAAPAA